MPSAVGGPRFGPFVHIENVAIVCQDLESKISNKKFYAQFYRGALQFGPFVNILVKGGLFF